jgi:hypothetical protein
MGETWLYHYDPETKKSMEWRHSGSARPQKFRVQKSAQKVLALPRVLGIKTASSSLISFQRAKTINAEYYLSMLVQLKDIFKEKRRGKFTTAIFVLSQKCPGSPGTCNPEETGLSGLPVS